MEHALSMHSSDDVCVCTGLQRALYCMGEFAALHIPLACTIVMTCVCVH